MASREICEKGRHGEGREAPHSALIGGADRLDDCRKASDARCDHGCRALLEMRVRRDPSCLRNGLGRGREGEQDEAIHPPLILGRNEQIRIEASVRVVGLRRNDSSDACGKGSRPLRERGKS